jgi:hypothetical protein
MLTDTCARFSATSSLERTPDSRVCRRAHPRTFTYLPQVWYLAFDAICLLLSTRRRADHRFILVDRNPYFSSRSDRQRRTSSLHRSPSLRPSFYGWQSGSAYRYSLPAYYGPYGALHRGKRALHLRIVDADTGQRMTKASRPAHTRLSALLRVVRCRILVDAIQPSKPGLHDRIANTVVIEDGPVDGSLPAKQQSVAVGKR